jgi:HlyD family secretion protein
MKKKIILSVFTLIVLVIIVKLIYGAVSGNGKTVYQFGDVTIGNMENTISSSGTLSPVTAVQVGTQVSGTIARIYVDFNDHVRKGQLLAVLDTVLLKAAVMDAQAGVEKAEAQLEQAQADYNRNKPLYDQKLISEAEFLPYQINLKTQKANLISAQASLVRAKRNLNYAVIRAPISGIVTQRNVEAGQTVAASFSTPTLFIIAENLSQMEILADVDESDIGQIKVGQQVRFTVQAYPEKEFYGVVKQIRLEPTTISNVVTYTVVIRATNEGNYLLPGMTATVDFIIEEKKDVLMVPNAALRFQPSEKIVAEFRKKRQQEMAAFPDSIKEKRRAQIGGQRFSGNMQSTGGMGGNQRSRNFGQVWYLDQNGKLAVDYVRTGMTDGMETEIVRSHHLQKGMKVITGLASAENARATEQNSGPPRFGRGRMF